MIGPSARMSSTSLGPGMAPSPGWQRYLTGTSSDHACSLDPPIRRWRPVSFQRLFIKDHQAQETRGPWHWPCLGIFVRPKRMKHYNWPGYGRARRPGTPALYITENIPHYLVRTPGRRPPRRARTATLLVHTFMRHGSGLFARLFPPGLLPLPEFVHPLILMSAS